MHNPYYNPGELDLEVESLDQPNMSYEYNTIAFWATKDGRVYSASDSGCSCPTPFEQYSGKTQNDVLPLLEQVENKDHAERLIKSWVQSIYDKDDRPSQSEQERFLQWIVTKFTLTL